MKLTDDKTTMKLTHETLTRWKNENIITALMTSVQGSWKTDGKSDISVLEELEYLINLQSSPWMEQQKPGHNHTNMNDPQKLLTDLEAGLYFQAKHIENRRIELERARLLLNAVKTNDIAHDD